VTLTGCPLITGFAVVKPLINDSFCVIYCLDTHKFGKRNAGLTFSPAESYFSPAMGRNGRNWGEMAETGEKLPDVFILRCKAQPCVSHGITKYICTGIQLNY